MLVDGGAGAIALVAFFGSDCQDDSLAAAPSAAAPPAAAAATAAAAAAATTASAAHSGVSRLSSFGF